MTIEEFIIAAVRILGSLPVLRWNFAGGIFAILIDLSDLFWRGWLDLGGVQNYQEFDKRLDLVFMATFLLAALRWQGLGRTVAVALLLLRVPGIVMFELTDDRSFLLLFPNIFAYWFVVVAFVRKWDFGREMKPKVAVALLTLCAAASVTHEWILHGGMYLETYSATGLVEEWWQWLTERF